MQLPARLRAVRIALIFSATILIPQSCLAEDAATIQVLQQQLQEMKAEFQKIQNAQHREIESLKKQLTEIKAANAAAKDPGAIASKSGEPPADTRESSAVQPVSVPAANAGAVRAGTAYMNLSFGSAMVAGGSTASEPSEQLELGDHDPQKRGFSLRNAELALDGAVDPYFKGFANIVLKLDEDNETDIELEESFAQTTSLHANLQLKAGQFFSNFGRQNPQHPHQWAFVDQPIILNRAFGPDGLRSIGTQLSWLAPTSFYTEVSLAVLDGQGGTAFDFRNAGEPDESGVNRFHGRATDENDHVSNFGDLVWNPRVASSFDLTDTQTLLVGTSGAFGSNSTCQDCRSSIYGVDAYWKWKPENANGGFPFVSWQTEALIADEEVGVDTIAGLPAETLRDYGAYSQVLWGFTENWVTGFRAEYADGDRGAFDEFDRYRGQRIRLAPVLTYFPSEFTKVRFQYNYDQGEYFPDASSVWLQFEFNLGAHAAHKF